MTEVLEKFYTLLNHALYNNCPVLSGNMRTGIKIAGVKDNEIKMVIDAPFYDLKTFDVIKKANAALKLPNPTGVILLTGEVRNGKTDYAYDVNKYGAFFKHNKSEGWVNKTCLDVAIAMSNELVEPGKDVVIIYDL